ncbi:hemerythrin domain-containing protein [Ammonicoccus fulvus]|uniref:Hemerythrin domain-containing protein n=1 Tax=Ammonicoccus fulvus TaxID=3138240 RepID=A0ABZ3FPC4_9ACTN
MTPSGEQLKHDHRVIDEGFARFAAAARAGRWETGSLIEAIRRLRLHIWVEEEIYFPPLREAGLMGPIMVMLKEHGLIWSHLEALEHLAGEAADLPAALAEWEELVIVLDQHNAKEETILYVTGDRILQADVSDQVAVGLDSDLPAGWSSAMATI